MALSGNIDLTEKLDFRKDKELPAIPSGKRWKDKLKNISKGVSNWLTLNLDGYQYSTTTWNTTINTYYSDDEEYTVPTTYRIYEPNTSYTWGGDQNSITFYYNVTSNTSSSFASFAICDNYYGNGSIRVSYNDTSTNYPWKCKNKVSMMSEYDSFHNSIHRKPDLDSLYHCNRDLWQHKYTEMESEPWVLEPSEYDYHIYRKDIREEIPWFRNLNNWILNDYMKDLYDDDRDYSYWLTNMSWLGLH